MGFLSRVLRKFSNQTLVYWEKIGSDEFGKPAFADPVELKVRWEDKQQEIVLPGGRTTRSDAYILSANPLVVGSMVFLGVVEDWQAIPTYPAIPTLNQGGREVVLLRTTPDIKATEFLYEAYL